MVRVQRRTTLLHEWSAKRHEQTQKLIEQTRELKEAAELEECSFAPKIYTHGKAQQKKNRTHDNNNHSNSARIQKAQKLLRRRQRNLGHDATTNGGIREAQPPHSRTFNEDSKRAIPSMYDEEFYESARAMYNVGKAKTNANGSLEKWDDDDNIDESPNIGEADEASLQPEYQHAVNDIMEDETTKDDLMAAFPESTFPLQAPPTPSPQEMEETVEAPPPEDQTSASMPVQEHEAILAAEKKYWVSRLKQENTTLVNVLCEVRSAKKQLLAEFEHLDTERSKFRTQQLERQESELEDTLLRMPLGLANHDAAGADGVFLHQLVGKMFYKLRANHQVVLNHMLRAATKVERKYLANPGTIEAVETDVAQLSEVVHYTNLSRYFEDHWGKPDERVLGRRTVALMAGTSLPPEHQTFPDSLKSLPPRPREEGLGRFGEMGFEEEPENLSFTEETANERGGEYMEKEIKALTAKNDVLKNNLKQLRQKNKDIRKGRGALSAVAAVSELKKGVSPTGSGVRAKTTKNSSAEPKSLAVPKRATWEEMPEQWKQVGWNCLRTTVIESIKDQSHDTNISEELMFEVSEFSMLELVDSFAPLLMVIIRLNKGPWDEANATDLCAKILTSPAMMCEIEPIVTMTMTYVKARGDVL